MALVTKPDFELAAAAWTRFWAGECDGPLVGATVLRDGAAPVAKPSAYALGPDLDIAAFGDELLAWSAAYEFLGAAIPFVYLEFAADQFATFLGAEMTFPTPGEGGWSTHPFADHDLATLEIAFQREGVWWRKYVAMCEQMMDRLAGRVLIAAPTFVANLDALVALRGSSQVLMDLVDQPDAVTRALAQITAAHGEITDAFANLLDVPTWGSINRHGMYSRAMLNLPQCDFSCMISPAMFRQFVQPCLAIEFGRYGGGEYHLDGPDAIRHLEALCELDDLHVIQWVCGAGNERRDWSELYRRIDALGKGQILGGPAASLARWAGELQTNRLFWNLRAASRDEALAVLAEYGWPHRDTGTVQRYGDSILISAREISILPP